MAENGQKWTKIIKIAFSDLTECLNKNVEENKTALELNFTHYMTSLGFKYGRKRLKIAKNGQ